MPGTDAVGSNRRRRLTLQPAPARGLAKTSGNLHNARVRRTYVLDCCGVDANNHGTLFAIGDVHGCADELDDLLALLPLKPDSTVVFLGDYIDRGPKSRQVIDRILALRTTHHVIALRGNHEAMLSEFLDYRDNILIARYVLNGGSATLASYANEDGHFAFPPEHLAFFDELRLSYDTPAHFFVHAGVPNVLLADLDVDQAADEMLWTRKNFLRSTFQWEKVIVHGHTPVESVEIAANRINIDTGCVYQGRLSAIEFPSHRIYSVGRRLTLGRTLLHDSSRRSAVRFRGAIPVHVRLDGELLSFETVDFSEIGLAIVANDPRDANKLALGVTIEGMIGADGRFRIAFQGRVVRAFRHDGREALGLEINLSDPALFLGPLSAPGPQGLPRRHHANCRLVAKATAPPDPHRGLRARTFIAPWSRTRTARRYRRARPRLPPRHASHAARSRGMKRTSRRATATRRRASVSIRRRCRRDRILPRVSGRRVARRPNRGPGPLPRTGRARARKPPANTPRRCRPRGSAARARP